MDTFLKKKNPVRPGGGKQVNLRTQILSRKSVIFTVAQQNAFR